MPNLTANWWWCDVNPSWSASAHRACQLFTSVCGGDSCSNRSIHYLDMTCMQQNATWRRGAASLACDSWDIVLKLCRHTNDISGHDHRKSQRNSIESVRSLLYGDDFQLNARFHPNEAAARPILSKSIWYHQLLRYNPATSWTQRLHIISSHVYK